MAHKKEDVKGELYGDAVREEIAAFAEEGYDSIPEDEREEWFTRFKFWGLFHQRDGQEGHFMMRLTNDGGVLEPGQLRAIAEVARDYATGPAANPRWGNGWVDFTTRQSIQLHWLDLEDVPDVWEKLESVGVSSRSSGGDTMRNISGCPLAGKSDAEYVPTRELLDDIQEDIRGDDELANLPRKFNISVTGCTVGCAQDSINDVALEPAHRPVDGERVRGFNVRVGGGLGGREPRKARSLDCFVTEEHASETVRAFVELYHEEGDRQNRSKNRARFFVDDWGTEAIREELDERLDVELRHAGTDFRGEYTYNAGKPSDEGKHDHVGVHDQTEDLSYVGLNVPVGRMPAADAIALADLADEYGSGEIRLTRRQNPLVVDVPDERVGELLEERLLTTYTPNPTVLSRGGMACTGTEFCSIALAETKTRTAATLQWLERNVSVPDDVTQLKIHCSGCTADCGQAMSADIGLQGMRARKDGEMVEAMDVGVGGGIGREPSFINWVHQRVPADEVPGLLKNVIEAYAEMRNDGQTFREWVAATGHETIAEVAEPEETDYADPCLYDAKRAWYPFADDEPSKFGAESDD